MRELSIDIETFSSIDISKCGVYAYAEARDFEILLFAYAFDNEKVQIVDLKMGEKIPDRVLSALLNKDIVKTAFNANFERVCLEKYLGMYMNPSMWRCTSVHCLELGLPSSLEAVSEILNLSNCKMKEGKALIRFFSCPYNNGRNYPQDNVEKWKLFKDYCVKDVEAEREIKRYLSVFPFYKEEQDLWILDQRINDRGILVHREIIENAIEGERCIKKRVLEKCEKIEGINNIGSPIQVKRWLEKRGIRVGSLNKEKIDELLKMDLGEDILEVLTLKKELSKTSIKKYEAMERSRCGDGRIRGLLQFYGANRTGRWAGRLVQVQNLPQNKEKDIDLCRKLLIMKEYDLIEEMYGSLSNMLSQLIRTTFIPRDGHSFIVSDFSAIEARVIAWLSDERWRIDVFNSHGKIYEASASKMFKVPIENVSKELRGKGKVSELALGYGGGTAALTLMGALKMGIEERELSNIVMAWRKENRNIVRLWMDIEHGAKEAIRKQTHISLYKGIEFDFERGILFVRLPSGRRLAYDGAGFSRDGFNKRVITYNGVNGKTKTWDKLKTYGGKLTENIIQAIARDLLGEAMIRLEKKGYTIVMHVHDEVVIETMEPCLEDINRIMEEEVAWAKGLTLKAESFIGDYYKKN